MENSPLVRAIGKPTIAVQSLGRRVWHWMQDQLYGDVSDADATCAFDCSKPNCLETEWATCERRMNRAAGELWPGPGNENSKAS